MAYKTTTICRKCSIWAILLLICLAGKAQYNFSGINQWLEDNTPSFGGRAVLVLHKDGKIIYSNAVNEMSRRKKMIGRIMARKQNKSANDAIADFDMNSRQRIASCSKWLTAALVMSFVDEGKLQLTDTVGKFLTVLSANGKGAITITHCLSHLTGIKTPGIKESMGEAAQLTDMDSSIRKIAAMPMEGKPGTVFHYSNAGLQIAAAVIEKVSGKDFETLFAERIARPCGMLNTDFGKGRVPLAAGGAWSTPADYINFLAMIVGNGKYKGKQVLSVASVAAMQQNYTKGVTVAYSPTEAGNWGYGFGEWIMNDAAGRSDAVSSPGLFGSFPWVDNKLGYAGFLFVYNLKNKDRNEKYKNLKQIADAAIEGR